MARWKVMVSAPYAMPVIDRYRAELLAAGCEVVVPDVDERLEEHELLPLVADIHGIICGDDRITERVLEAASALKVISKWGTGIDSIDRDAAERRGVAVCNTPNAFSEPVADTVFGYLLMFTRRLHEVSQRMHAGEWNKPKLIALGERSLGVVGVGDCGKAVVRRAAGFGMRILAHDTAGIPDELVEWYGLNAVSLDEVLAGADFVTLHTDLNPTSHHLINAGSITRMKPEAYLINTSRGPVVDEAALEEALIENRIAGAALDVFEDEPLPKDSRLRGMDNVFLSPHTANSSPAAHERVHATTIANLLNVLDHGGR